MDTLPIFLGFLMLVYQVSGQDINANLINPKPVKIKSEMTVTCSKDSIGGIGMLDNLNPEQSISKVEMFRQVGEAAKQSLAEYNVNAPLQQYQEVVKPDQPRGLTQNNYKFEGRGETSPFTNVDTIKLTLSVTEATCELVTAYFCEFSYYTTSGLIKKSFMDNTTNIIDVGEVIMDATPSYSDSDGYDMGESITFNCKIRGTLGMRLAWEAARCNNLAVYNELGDLDQNAEIIDNSKDLTPAICNGPVREYNKQLVWNATDTYCSVRCVAYDKDGKKIENYSELMDQNIINGTKGVATKATGGNTGAISAGGGDDIGMIVGILFGVIAVIIIALLLVYFCWYKKRGQNSRESDYKPDEENGPKDIPPPVFFTKPEIDDKDHSRRNEALENSFDSKDSASRRYANSSNPVNSNPDGSRGPRGRSNRAYDGNGSLHSSLAGSRDQSIDRSFDGDDNRGDRQYRRRSDRERDRRHHRPYSTEDGTSEQGSYHGRYGDGDPTMGTAI